MHTVSINDLKSTVSLAEQYQLTSSNPYSEKYSSSNKSILVFVDGPDRPGPFGDGQGTIQDEFIWRRSNSAPIPPSALLQIIKPLVESKIKGLRLTGEAYFSRYAGCSCPCSPGFIVKTFAYSGHRWSFHLAHTTVIQRRKEREAQRLALETENNFIAAAMGVHKCVS